LKVSNFVDLGVLKKQLWSLKNRLGSPRVLVIWESTRIDLGTLKDRLGSPLDLIT